MSVYNPTGSGDVHIPKAISGGKSEKSAYEPPKPTPKKIVKKAKKKK